MYYGLWNLRRDYEIKVISMLFHVWKNWKTFRVQFFHAPFFFFKLPFFWQFLDPSCATAAIWVLIWSIGCLTVTWFSKLLIICLGLGRLVAKLYNYSKLVADEGCSFFTSTPGQIPEMNVKINPGLPCQRRQWKQWRQWSWSHTPCPRRRQPCW